MAEGEEINHPETISIPDDSSSASASSGYGRIRRDEAPLPSLQTLPSLQISTNSTNPASFEASSRSFDGWALAQTNEARGSFEASAHSFDGWGLASPASLEYDSTGDFDFDFELPLRWYKRVWVIILCIAGIFDILTYLEPTLRSSYNETCTLEDEYNGVSKILLDGLEILPKVSAPWYCSTWLTFLNRLRDYNLVVAFAFSLLWFKNSESKASEAYYYKFKAKEDRIQLMSSDNQDEHEDGNCDSPRKQRKKKQFNALNAYYRRILSRTLLLPVGFYIIIYQLMQGLMHGEWRYRELLIKPANETAFLTIQDPNLYVDIEITKAHAKMSTIVAIFLFLKHHFLLLTEHARTEVLRSARPKLRRKLLGDAVRNPRNFIRQLKKVLKYIRWIKYSIPLILKLNKLRANAVATLRKIRQYKKKQKQNAIRTQKSKSEIEVDAALLQMAANSMKDKKQAAVLKIQRSFRRASVKNRLKQNYNKMRELIQLEQLKRQATEELNDEDRRRLYQLQDEFMAEAKKTINKRLLVRPNTRLAVLWNYFFVFCVLVEISFNAMKPWLIIPKAQRVDDQKYRSMRLFLAESLVPTPVEETSACKDLFKKRPAFQRLFFHSRHVEQPTRQEVVSAFIDEIVDMTDPDYGQGDFHIDTNHTIIKEPKIKWRCREPILSWRNNYRDMIALAFRPNPVSEWSECNEKEKSLVGKIVSPFRKKRAKKLPWYCLKPYSQIHDWYRSIWNFIIDQVQFVISVICFFDVFVKFFTGDIDKVTGELKPKPFIRRWIFPGLLLQLLVNPSIVSFSTSFFRFVDWVMVIGPVRVLRWFIAVIVPILYGVRNLVINALQEAESDKQLAKYGMMLWEYSQ